MGYGLIGTLPYDPLLFKFIFNDTLRNVISVQTDGFLYLYCIDLNMSAGWLASLTTSAFNRPGPYASSPGNTAYCYAELAVSSLA